MVCELSEYVFGFGVMRVFWFVVGFCFCSVLCGFCFWIFVVELFVFGWLSLVE